jgi:hypothetical protein
MKTERGKTTGNKIRATNGIATLASESGRRAAGGLRSKFPLNPKAKHVDKTKAISSASQAGLLKLFLFVSSLSSSGSVFRIHIFCAQRYRPAAPGGGAKGAAAAGVPLLGVCSGGLLGILVLLRVNVCLGNNDWWPRACQRVFALIITTVCRPIQRSMAPGGGETGAPAVSVPLVDVCSGGLLGLLHSVHRSNAQ